MAYIATDVHAVDPGDLKVIVPIDYDHVSVQIGQLSVHLTDPGVAEEIARTFWDAADHLHAKSGVTGTDASVARTLAIATGGAA